MQQTFEQFKQIIEQSKGSAPFEIKPEMIEQFYKEQCLQQIGADMNLALGYFLQNQEGMSPEQLYEWSIAIRNFFGIQVSEGGNVTSSQDEPSVTSVTSAPIVYEGTPVGEIRELTKEEKIEQAKKNLEKSGLWI